MENFNELLASLSARIGSVLPSIIGAVLVLIIGLIVASFIRKIVAKLLRKTQLDERINRGMNTSFDFEKILSTLAYYLVLLFVVLLVLDLLGMDSVLDPLKTMLANFSAPIPNLVGAGLIGFAGYILGKIASEAVGLIATALENFSEKIGWQGEISITKIVKQLVFLVVFIPLLIIALDYMKMYAITGPATEMLGMLLAAIPKILFAIAILAVFYFVGRYMVSVVVTLLKNLGTDKLADHMEIDAVLGSKSISDIIGKVLFFFLMFAGVISAADKLEMGELSDILNHLMTISGKIIFGLIIMMFGNFISIQASKLVTGEDRGPVRNIARYAILIIFFAMALHTMGIAPSIVNLAFGLTLGAVAVAAALAFGLGGREAAGKHLDHLLKNWRNEK
jgi:hypothetical protein